MAEIVKYKFFNATEDFELWQKTETPMRVHSVVPVVSSQHTVGSQGSDGSAVNLSNNPIYAVFVTYVDYAFPAEEDPETPF